ncbi:MAG TPA: tetratricopeptide repeat protein, partial [Polyangiaceae bacterium]|nr:tetratricopeptide repeat protein [Polyangiaceae bacterium]
TASLVPRLWAAEYVRRLMGSGDEQDDNRGQILQLGVEYGLVTPFTSSLALDSESAYARQGIPRRRSRLRGVRLTAIESPAHEDSLTRAFAPPAPPSLMGCDAPAARKGAPARESSAKSEPMPADLPAAAAQPIGAGASDEKSEGQHNAAPATAEAAPLATATHAPPAPPPAPKSAGRASGALDDEGEERGGGGDLRRTAPAAVAGPAADGVSGTAVGGIGGRTAAQAAPRPAPKPAAPTSFSSIFRRGRPDAAAEAKKPEDKSAVPKLPPAPPAARLPLARVLARCSDVASRPLSERLVLWQKRAKRATNAAELAAVYDQAYASCELPDWRDEAALLDVIQRRVDTEQAAEVVLGHFASFPDGQRFLARNLLRRTVDVRVAAAVSRVLYGGVDWLRVDRELADVEKPDVQLARLKAAMLVAPGDPQGDVRLVRLLARSPERRQEALALGRRLRDRGALTPTLAQQLGDALAEAGERDEALRTYSEIVEFDGTSPASRRVLGDVFLRQGWYPAAYRQYKTLTDLDGKNPLAWLRLANAAAGAGRVDEALRVEREVAAGEGTPGPNDPRAFARLLSAARLGALLEA